MLARVGVEDGGTGVVVDLERWIRCSGRQVLLDQTWDWAGRRCVWVALTAANERRVRMGESARQAIWRLSLCSGAEPSDPHHPPPVIKPPWAILVISKEGRKNSKASLVIIPHVLLIHPKDRPCQDRAGQQAGGCQDSFHSVMLSGRNDPAVFRLWGSICIPGHHS
jgi:hypothetical protein